MRVQPVWSHFINNYNFWVNTSIKTLKPKLPKSPNECWGISIVLVCQSVVQRAHCGSLVKPAVHTGEECSFEIPLHCTVVHCALCTAMWKGRTRGCGEVVCSAGLVWWHRTTIVVDDEEEEEDDNDKTDKDPHYCYKPVSSTPRDFVTCQWIIWPFLISSPLSLQ